MPTKFASKLTRHFALLALPALSLIGVPSLAAEDEKPTLTVFNWSEYIDPEVYAQFEKEFNCTVKEVTFETPEEAINKMIAGGTRTFDVCSVGSDFMVPSGIAQNVFKKLDHSKIPNLKNLAPLFQDPGYDPGNSHTIPYQWGTTGVFIRKELVPADGFSLDAFFKPGAELGRFAMIDSAREMLAYANIRQGKPANDIDLAVLKNSIELMTTAKKSKKFMGFDGGVGGIAKVVAGTADYAIAYNGDAIRNMDENPGKFAYVIPNEGAPVWTDSIGIAKDAPNVELAYAFLNYVLDAKIGAQISAWTKYASPNAAAKPLLPAEDLANPAIYPTEAQMAKLQFLKNLGPKETIRNDAWTAVKSN